MKYNSDEGFQIIDNVDADGDVDAANLVGLVALGPFGCGCDVCNPVSAPQSGWPVTWQLDDDAPAVTDDDDDDDDDDDAPKVDPGRVDWSNIEKIVNSKRRRSGTDETLGDRLVREHTELSIATAVLIEKLIRRERQIEHLKRYPVVDPFTDGTILRFEKKFPGGERRYKYVATRIDELWYVTGSRSPQGVPWERLAEFMGLGVDEVWHVNYTRPKSGNHGTWQQERKVIG